MSTSHSPVGFQVGDVVIHIEGADESVRSLPSCPPQPGAPASMRLRVIPWGSAPARGEILHDLETITISRTEAGALFELRQLFTEADTYGVPFIYVELPPDSSEGRISCRPGVFTNVLTYNPVSELLTLEILGRGRGVLVHSCGFAVDGKAYLLPGISGTGKTTIARALAELPGVEILSDERVVARPAPGVGPHGWVVDGTPWPGEGEYTSTRTVPLHGVLFPQQAERDSIEPIGGAKALGMLYRCHFRPFWRPDAPQRTLDLLQRLVEEVPRALVFNRLGGAMPQTLVERLRAEPG